MCVSTRIIDRARVVKGEEELALRLGDKVIVPMCVRCWREIQNHKKMEKQQQQQLGKRKKNPKMREIWRYFRNNSSIILFGTFKCIFDEF
jgi:hypothetical protein